MLNSRNNIRKRRIKRAFRRHNAVFLIPLVCIFLAFIVVGMNLLPTSTFTSKSIMSRPLPTTSTISTSNHEEVPLRKSIFSVLPNKKLETYSKHQHSSRQHANIAEEVDENIAKCGHRMFGIASEASWNYYCMLASAPSKNQTHTSTMLFPCRNGKQFIALSYVNDDYCDCDDGSDEPGTSACSNIKVLFECGDRQKSIPTSMVNDGVRDCADGSDEYSPSLSVSQ